MLGKDKLRQLPATDSQMDMYGWNIKQAIYLRQTWR